MIINSFFNVINGRFLRRRIFHKNFSRIPYLSPSQLNEFKNCPRKYFYRYILKCKEPPNLVLLKGNSVHQALENFYSGSKVRSPENLAEEVSISFHEGLSSKFDELFDKEEEYSMFEAECIEQSMNLFSLENVRCVKPLYLEKRMGLEVDVPSRSSSSAPKVTMKLVGIADRIEENEKGKIGIVDYKTGPSPNTKRYPRSMKQMILEERFYQLRLYALMSQQTLNLHPSYLSLIFLGWE